MTDDPETDDSERRPYALVADDDAFIRMDACDILDEAGFRTLEAWDLDSGLDLLRKHCKDIQLLFTDVQMKGARDGFDLAITTARECPRIGILVASGQAEPGPDDIPEGAVFIRKPFSADVVHDRVRQILTEGQLPEPLKT
ncbi:MAG: response regulator [Methylobacterium mesophilicum]|nr:response regulator [Methylobacterium mesophilicum]